VLRFGPEAVDRYIEEAKALGFDVIELSTGFISLPTESLLRLIQKVKSAGLKAKPELGIQFGAGGGTAAEELAAEGTKDVGWLIGQAERALDAGADIIMIESEGVTENVSTWRTDVVARIFNQLGLEKVMFEGADPAVFEWYIKNYGNEVNVFVDHSQIIQLEALRSGIWAPKAPGAAFKTLLPDSCGWKQSPDMWQLNTVRDALMAEPIRGSEGIRSNNADDFTMLIEESETMAAGQKACERVT
jgi:phosphosulfolactate synthase (CoM biosynthesis protein A)